MATLEFEDFTFQEGEDTVQVSFMNIFATDIAKSQLNKIGTYALDGHCISFEDTSQEKAQRRFSFLLEDSFGRLKNKMTGKPVYYIHRNSGIPLVGTNYFGLIDRGTNVIEVKPLTSCNISCPFCSVDEGPTSRRKLDYVIEKDYVVQELRKVVKLKGVDDIDAHINAQGEPTLYKDLVPLVSDIMNIPGVKTSSIDTNGTMLNEQVIDQLADAGLSRINLSLHAVDPKIAKVMAGAFYNVKRVMEMAAYAATKMDLVLTPVWLKGYNDEELPKLARFAEEIGAGHDCPPIAIQNFMPYKMGRNPIKDVPFDDFFKRMKELEKAHDVTLLHNKGFGIHPVKEIPKPFKRDEVIDVEIKLPGRIGSEKLGVAKDRVISIPSCHKSKGTVKVRIKRRKHNVFVGELV